MRDSLFIDDGWVPARRRARFPPSIRRPRRLSPRWPAATKPMSTSPSGRPMPPCGGPGRGWRRPSAGACSSSWPTPIAGRREELARLETLDVGKPLKDSLGDVDGVVTTLRYNAGAADKMQGETIPLGPRVVDFTLLEPLGVTAHIVPWNYPLGMAIRSLAPALRRRLHHRAEAGGAIAVERAHSPRSCPRRVFPRASSMSCPATARRPAPRWCAIRWCAASASPARSERPQDPVGAAPASSRWCWSSAARIP